MNALVRKEIRLILPFWGIAMALAIVPAWLVPDHTYRGEVNQLVFWLFGFGILLLGLAPFGQEFGLGTFSFLLAQPFERRRIWKTKILLAAVAAALVFVGFILSLHERLYVIVYSVYNQKEAGAELWQAMKAGLLLIVLALSSGFWATLLFRQTGAAMWFAILVPTAAFGVIQWLMHSLPGQDFLLVLMWLAYSVGGFLWARRMFLSAQDSQWLGETISVLSLSPAKATVDSAVSRRRKPLAALVRKEFQSHQISFIVAFGLLVLHLFTLFYRRFGSFADSNARYAVESVPFLWVLVPWLIGSVAIAEERKSGTMESQLCLPVSRRLQFTVKISIVLLLGLVLGGLMPWIIESIGAWFHVPGDPFGRGGSGRSHLVAPNPVDFENIRVFVTVCLVAGFIAVASFFASSLTRNTLHALGAAIFLGGALFMLFQWVLLESNDYQYSLWKGPLILIISVPVALIAVLWLSFSNYKRLHSGRNLWLRNPLILSVTLFFTGIGTAFIYQRPWELAMSLEPHHGPARLSGTVRPTICMPIGGFFALLPDGRLWAASEYRVQEFNKYEEVWDAQGQSNRLRKLSLRLPSGGSFLGGSNWVALAAYGGSFGAVALQSDGTMWEFFPPEVETNRAAWLALKPQPRRLGSDSDWKSIAAAPGYFLAIKTNGTLWGWGNNEGGRLAPNGAERVYEPVQIGKESDWTELFSRNGEPFVLKKNSAIYEFTLGDMRQRYILIGSRFSGPDYLSIAGSREQTLALRRDGTLWASGYLRVLFGTHVSSERAWESRTQIGDRSDWNQISGSVSVFAAIHKDGSLVENENALFGWTLGQPSRYSDWLTVNRDWNGLVALASDGTVTAWRDIRVRYDFLLAPTHRPLWSLNIFADSKN